RRCSLSVCNRRPPSPVREATLQQSSRAPICRLHRRFCLRRPRSPLTTAAPSAIDVGRLVAVTVQICCNCSDSRSVRDGLHP
ncbi:hypothetical protein CSA_023563, partial [Cucumis sativus]